MGDERMTSMRRSLPALDRLEQAIKYKISNLHGTIVKKTKSELSEINDKRAKEIIADIEQYAVIKYPELKIPLKCERAHSTVNSDNIQVGFRFSGADTPLASQLKLMIVQEEDAERNDRAVLERWKMGCLQAMAAGEGFPPIVIPGLDDASSDPFYG